MEYLVVMTMERIDTEMVCETAVLQCDGNRVDRRVAVVVISRWAVQV
jgi:hypothetical protein